MSIINFGWWAAVLFIQNWSFTYVSRARNSGSLSRHAKAALFSNGVWILSQMLMLGPMFNMLTGKNGLALQIAAGVLYTAATMSGSLAAHFVAKRTEKGSDAVGASARYAQIPVEEYAELKKLLGDFGRVQKLAEQAYDISFGTVPMSNITAQKIGGEIVTTGIPEK